MTARGDIASTQLPPWEVPFLYKHPLPLWTGSPQAMRAEPFLQTEFTQAEDKYSIFPQLHQTIMDYLGHASTFW